jgi:hypothetical protein
MRMNPILPTGIFPATPIFLNGYMDLIVVLTAAALAIMFGVMLWNVHDLTRERAWAFCPVWLRSVRVLFRLAPDGAPSEVLHCSLLGRGPITACRQACLRQTAAI